MTPHAHRSLAAPLVFSLALHAGILGGPWRFWPTWPKPRPPEEKKVVWVALSAALPKPAQIVEEKEDIAAEKPAHKPKETAPADQQAEEIQANAPQEEDAAEVLPEDETEIDLPDEVDAEPEAQPKPPPKPAPQPKPRPAPKPEPEPKPQPLPKTEPVPQPPAHPEPKPEPPPAPRPPVPAPRVSKPTPAAEPMPQPGPPKPRPAAPAPQAKKTAKARLLYQTNVKRRIQRALRYPRRARRKRRRGETRVLLTIRRAGALADVRVQQSSGYRPFDLEAVKAVRRAAPFGPAPKSLPGAPIRMVVTIVFEPPPGDWRP